MYFVRKSKFFTGSILTFKRSAMKSVLPLLALTLIFASCSSAYKSGQTPDDVYYSPARPVEEYVRQDKNDDRNDRYDDEVYRDDRYLRMKIRDRRYVGMYEDYYSYNPYYYHYLNSSLNYNSPWTSYSYWNYYYNPNCCCGHPGTTATATISYSKPRTFDLSMYNQNQSMTTNAKGQRTYGLNNSVNTRSGNSRNGYYGNTNNSNNYRGSGTNAGNFLRDAMNSSSSNSSNSKSGSSSSGSSSSGSSSSSGGSTNAPARRF
jgi:hypothetical protein